MEENNYNENPAPEPAQEKMSTGDILAGVISSPGETYSEMAVSKPANYWLVPMIIVLVLNMITVFLSFQNPELIQKQLDETLQKTKSKLEEQVKAGDITKEQADQALEMQEKFTNPESPFFKIMGYVGTLFSIVFIFLILSLAVYLGMKVFKSGMTFQNVLNVVGSASVITAIGGIVAIVISILLDDLKSVGPALFVDKSTVGDVGYNVLSSFDVFSIWAYAVIAVGLTKIGKVSAGKAYGLVFGLWILWLAVVALFSVVFGSMF
jgi:hypothetical protein